MEFNFEKEKELILAFKNGDSEAFKQAVEMNIGLIQYLIRLYFNKLVDIHDDLISEGALGIMRAIERADVNSLDTFAAYKRQWIMSKMIRFIKKQQRPTNGNMSYDTLLGHVPTNEDSENYHEMCDINVSIATEAKQETITAAHDLMKRVLDANILRKDEIFVINKMFTGWQEYEINNEFFEGRRIAFYHYKKAVDKMKRFVKGHGVPKVNAKRDKATYKIP